jgi:hypothetical protein
MCGADRRVVVRRERAALCCARVSLDVYVRPINLIVGARSCCRGRLPCCPFPSVRQASRYPYREESGRVYKSRTVADPMRDLEAVSRKQRRAAPNVAQVESHSRLCRLLIVGRRCSCASCWPAAAISTKFSGDYPGERQRVGA